MNKQTVQCPNDKPSKKMKPTQYEKIINHGFNTICTHDSWPLLSVRCQED